KRPGESACGIVERVAREASVVFTGEGDGRNRDLLSPRESAPRGEHECAIVAERGLERAGRRERFACGAEVVFSRRPERRPAFVEALDEGQIAPAFAPQTVRGEWERGRDEV